jgi:hypothetical protein
MPCMFIYQLLIFQAQLLILFKIFEIKLSNRKTWIHNLIK